MGVLLDFQPQVLFEALPDVRGSSLCQRSPPGTLEYTKAAATLPNAVRKDREHHGPASTGGNYRHWDLTKALQDEVFSLKSTAGSLMRTSGPELVFHPIQFV